MPTLVATVTVAASGASASSSRGPAQDGTGHFAGVPVPVPVPRPLRERTSDVDGAFVVDQQVPLADRRFQAVRATPRAESVERANAIFSPLQVVHTVEDMFSWADDGISKLKEYFEPRGGIKCKAEVRFASPPVPLVGGSIEQTLAAPLPLQTDSQGRPGGPYSIRGFGTDASLQT